jgi:acylphosphatase
VRRLRALVTGRVQGVGFREYVRYEASARGLTGYVRNCDDGRSVEVVAEGADEALQALLEVLHVGPRFARIAHVDSEYSEAGGGFARFSVEY